MTPLRALVLAGLLAGVSCRPPPRMCAQETDCGAQASCVAGRCVVHGATPAIDTARRLVVGPVDVGYVARRASASPSIATLGRTADDAVAFLRFSLPLPPEANVLEAYVVLERATSLDEDPASVALHVVRVTSAWDGASLSWATQPRIEEVGAPVTRVFASAGPLVRLDVRDVVERWRRRSRDDLGLAVVADATSATGVALVLTPTDAAPERADPILGGASHLVGPRLEVYVK